MVHAVSDADTPEAIVEGGQRLVHACPVEDLPTGQALRVEGSVPIALFNIDGEFCAIGDTCTHREASLAEGYLEGDEVECPLHASRFNVRTGEVSGPPALEPVPSFPVVVRDGQIYIEDTPQFGPS